MREEDAIKVIALHAHKTPSLLRHALDLCFYLLLFLSSFYVVLSSWVLTTRQELAREPVVSRGQTIGERNVACGMFTDDSTEAHCGCRFALQAGRFVHLACVDELPATSTPTPMH